MDISADRGVARLPAQLGAEFFRTRANRLIEWTAGLWIMGAGFVLVEPSPYEYLFLVVVALAAVAGVRLRRSTAPLLILLVLFTPFALIAAFQVKNNTLTSAFIFQIVTLFLLITSYFISNYVAERTYERVRIIMYCYTAMALISALIGLFAYLGVIPGQDIFLRYGRAKAMFKDPNVYGPFLILPAMFALQRLLLLTDMRRLVISGVIFSILFLGVFFSFSRAAWGHLAGSTLMLYFMNFFLVAHARDKVRMMLLALGGGAVLIVGLAGIVSVPSVNDLFETRFNPAQNYDTGDSGRFGRQGYAFELALQHPWGLGPQEFQTLRIVEAPHNTYVTVVHHYGWGGGLCYFALVLLTLYRGLKGLKDNHNRLLLIPLMSVYIALVIEAAIIDIDHWRHYFLIVGLIWGVASAPKKVLSRAEMV